MCGLFFLLFLMALGLLRAPMCNYSVWIWVTGLQFSTTGLCSVGFTSISASFSSFLPSKAEYYVYIGTWRTLCCPLTTIYLLWGGFLLYVREFNKISSKLDVGNTLPWPYCHLLSLTKNTYISHWLLYFPFCVGFASSPSGSLWLPCDPPEDRNLINEWIIAFRVEYLWVLASSFNRNQAMKPCYLLKWAFAVMFFGFIVGYWIKNKV